MIDPTNFSHLDEQGNAAMVDVGAKPVVMRIAEAEGRICMAAETIRAIREGNVPKGDVLAVARIAGIQAAKRTDELIPLCHSLPLDVVAMRFEFEESAVHIIATAKCSARTGVEMEALTAVSVAALTIYDMCKAVDKTMRIEGIRLVKKEKREANS
jgi:cyclic pyranopterin phosphate synthase